MEPSFQTRAKATILMLAACAIACQAEALSIRNDSLEINLLGSWQLSSYNYIGLPQKLPAGRVCLKTITRSRYTWVYYDTSTKEVISSGGGSYLLEANICKETVDYAQGVRNDFRSAAQKNCYMTPAELEHLYMSEKILEIQLKGDVLKVTAKLPNGYLMEEIWYRVN